MVKASARSSFEESPGGTGRERPTEAHAPHSAVVGRRAPARVHGAPEVNNGTTLPGAFSRHAACGSLFASGPGTAWAGTSAIG